MRKLLFILSLGIVLFVLVNSVKAQFVNQEFIEVNDLGNKIEIIVDNGKYVLKPYNNNIIHTAFIPQNEDVMNYSYAVSMIPEGVEYSIIDEDSIIMLNTKAINVVIIKNPFQIKYYFHEKFLIAKNNVFYKTRKYEGLKFSITKNEILYGGGARVLGMNRRGNKLELYNRAHYGYSTRSELMNYSLPIFISSKKYMVFFDNASKGFLDLDSDNTNTVSFEAVSGVLNYYVIAEDNWFDLVKQYTGLTGRQPLPPRWAFGNYSSRFGYHSQEEVLNTISRFSTDSIPVDAVIIDIYWFGPEIFDAMGKLDWYRDSFPNPDIMISELKEKGIKTILVTEPFILTTSDRWQEAVDKKVLGKKATGEPYIYDFYFGNTGLVDVFDPKAKNWFWEIYRGLIEQGVEGQWGDLGEPEVHPGNLVHINGTADDVHNAYGHKWTQLIYEGYQKDYPDIRPFILMRAGYAGSQRYGIIPWTGDVSRSWGGLVPQPEISLQMGMQGIAYMHSDLGGFAGGDSIDNELYIRWLQYGVFQPVYRPHAQEHIPPEPVFYNDTTKAHARVAIELRYKLLPYIYNMAFENSQTGKPLMVPLFFNDTNNNDLLTYDEAYMWGDAFLVSPVKEQGKKYQTVYFPEGNIWTDFYTGKAYQGGKYDSVSLLIDHIPVFVKSGSFIPMLRKAENTNKFSLKQLDMHHFSDKNNNYSTYDLYNDDGKTPFAFEKNQYETLRFKSSRDENGLTITQECNSHMWENATNSGNINLIVHNLNEKPEKITHNNEKLEKGKIHWNKEKKVLFINYDWTNEQVKIRIYN